jgi:hypothetical protein
MRRTLGWLAAAALAGCGGSDEDSGPGIAMSAAAEQIAATVCPKAYGCCTPMQLMENDQAGGDVASCQAKTRQGFGGHFDNVRNSQQKGRARYRGDRLADCLAHIQAASCQELATTNHFSGVAGCEALVEPLLPAGASCANDFECIDGSCHKAEDAAEGTCQPHAGAGQSCESASCGANALCSGDRTCVELAPDGASCTDLAQCRSFNCSAGVCAPPAADKCFYSSSCAYGRGRPAALPLLALALFWVRRRFSSSAGSRSSPSSGPPAPSPAGSRR